MSGSSARTSWRPCTGPPRSSFERPEDRLQVVDVRVHRALGRRRLAAPDGTLDLAMLAQDLLALDRDRDVRDQVRLQDVEDPAGERLQQRVARGLGEDAVEARVGGVERLGAGRVALGVVDRLLQAVRGVGARVAGGEAGERDLQEQARVQQLVERDALGRQHHRDRLADVAAHALVGRARDEDAAGAAAANTDQVRAGQQPQPLAQRGTADAELGGELLLGPDPVARLQVLLLEIAADLERDQLAGVRARPREAVAGELRSLRHAGILPCLKCPNDFVYPSWSRHRPMLYSVAASAPKRSSEASKQSSASE